MTQVNMNPVTAIKHIDTRWKKVANISILLGTQHGILPKPCPFFVLLRTLFMLFARNRQTF